MSLLFCLLLVLSKEEIDRSFNAYDFKRLEMYSLNLVDYHLVIDLVPEIARLYFINKLGEDFSLSLVQAAILIAMGLQRKSVEDLEKELQLPPNQVLALFNKIVKKTLGLLEKINVSEVSKKLFKNQNGNSEALEKMKPLEQTLEDELNEASRQIKAEEQEKKKQLLGADFKQYEIKGSEKEWSDALKVPVNTSYVTVKRSVCPLSSPVSADFLSNHHRYLLDWARSVKLSTTATSRSLRREMIIRPTENRTRIAKKLRKAAVATRNSTKMATRRAKNSKTRTMNSHSGVKH